MRNRFVLAILTAFGIFENGCTNSNNVTGPSPTPFASPTQVPATPIPPTATPIPSASLDVAVSVTLNDNGHIVALRESVLVSAQGRSYHVMTSDDLTQPAHQVFNDLTPNQYFVVTAQVENDPCISTYSSDSIILLPGANSFLAIGLRNICPH